MKKISSDTPDAASRSLVQLSAGQLHLALTPEVGGSIARFSRRWQEAGKQREVHWLRPASPEGLAQRNPLAMASFPLLPFCNRIREGRAHFEGRDIRFPPNHPSAHSPHPLHGIGWQQPWHVISSNPAEAVLGLEVDASEAWPWAFTARQEFALDEKGLSVTMTLTNEDTAAMPAGIGHHPYFPHEPGTRLRMPSAAMWEGDAQVMPKGLVESEAVRKLRDGVVVGELELDNNFVGWDHWSRVDWPLDAKGPARSLLMEAEAPLDYFVVYCPQGYDHFCAEPVSQCTDWLNLMAEHGPGPLGGTRLAPGETLTARFRLVPGWHG